jgi:hypothetical protein
MKQNQELRVSDHAIVRYFERVLGVDMDQVRNKIATNELKRVHKQLGDGKLPMKDFTAVIKNGVVLTVLK